MQLSLPCHIKKNQSRHVMLSGSEASGIGHDVWLVRPDASLPLSMTRQEAFVMHATIEISLCQFTPLALYVMMRRVGRPPTLKSGR
jgi:hypothetical protein